MGSSRSTSESTPAPGTRLRDYATTELTQAIACLGWRGSRLHAGVHQARKSLRRARATLALGAATLGPGAVLIDRELRRLNRRLSKLRDTQALVGTLDHLLRKNADTEAAAILRRSRRVAAHARAERARTTMTTDPHLRDRRALLAVLQAALSALPWQTVAETEAHDALRVSATRADEAAARAQRSGRDEDWHRWRRRARRLSQQLRALGDSIAAPPEIGEGAKRLAILLGEAQDYALLREHCGKRSVFAPADRAMLRELSERGTAHLQERIRAELPAARHTQSDFRTVALRNRAGRPVPSSPPPEPVRRRSERSSSE